MTKPIREGFQSIVPYLTVQEAARLVEFLRVVFGATQTFRSHAGTHYEVKIGDSMVMIGDVGNRAPTPGQLFLYVEDADAVYERALQAGATSLLEPSDRGWGEGEALMRGAGVKDPTGNSWYLAGGAPKGDASRRSDPEAISL